MRPSRRADRFHRLRKHAIARVCAMWFIALILLPFTAPFPTYQLDGANSHPYDALPKEFKNKIDADDGLIVPADVRLAVPAFASLALSWFLPSDRVAAHTLQHTILRL